MKPFFWNPLYRTRARPRSAAPMTIIGQVLSVPRICLNSVTSEFTWYPTPGLPNCPKHARSLRTCAAPTSRELPRLRLVTVGTPLAANCSNSRRYKLNRLTVGLGTVWHFTNLSLRAAYNTRPQLNLFSMQMIPESSPPRQPHWPSRRDTWFTVWARVWDRRRTLAHYLSHHTSEH